MRARLAVLVSIVARSVLGQGFWSSWSPVTQAELSLQNPVVQEDAGTEALFWEIKVLDHTDRDGSEASIDYYLRLKVFDEKGVAAATSLSWARDTKSISLYYFGVRVVRPDGSIVESKPAETSTEDAREKIKRRYLKGIEPGSIVDFRWGRNYHHSLSSDWPIVADFPFPVQVMRVHIKPDERMMNEYGFRVRSFQQQGSGLVPEVNGALAVTFTNLPALHEEPWIPGTLQILPWLHMCYSRDKPDQQLWQQVSRRLYNLTQTLYAPSDEIRRIANQQTQAHAEPEDKLASLIRFCRAHVKNLGDEGVTQAERDESRANRSPVSTLRHAAGTAEDLNTLFAALARGAGFDARYVMLPDRGLSYFDWYPLDEDLAYALTSERVAVKINSKWRIYDPSSPVPSGMLRSEEEGVRALIADPKEPIFVLTPAAAPERSLISRTGRFELSEDGKLQGDVTIKYTGHAAVKRRGTKLGQSTRNEDPNNDSAKFCAASREISELAFEGLDDPDQPLIEHYHLSLPGFAHRSSGGLIFQPAYFQCGLPPVFVEAERKYDIDFQYASRSTDAISYKLPAGYSLTDPSKTEVRFGDLGDFTSSTSEDRSSDTLIYHRDFVLGRKSLVYLNKAQYPLLKQGFDRVHDGDQISVHLVQHSADSHQ